MNTSKQQAAMAELRGWKFLPTGPEEWEWFDPDTKKPGVPPNYAHDMAAVQEVLRYLGVNVVDSDQWEALGHAIENEHPQATIMPMKAAPTVADYYDFATLVAEITPEMIVSAILKTLQLWEDE